MKDIKIKPNYEHISFDVVNTYTNIPVAEMLNILRDNLTTTNKLHKQGIDELMWLLRALLEQNYFVFDDNLYIQADGLAIGSPLSVLLAEIYLNYFQNEHIMFINNKYRKNITF